MNQWWTVMVDGHWITPHQRIAPIAALTAQTKKVLPNRKTEVVLGHKQQALIGRGHGVFVCKLTTSTSGSHGSEDLTECRHLEWVSRGTVEPGDQIDTHTHNIR